MRVTGNVLRSQAGYIAAAAAAFTNHIELEQPLARFVTQLADNIDDGANVDLASLRAELKDEDAVARVLRSVEAQMIEAMRKNIEPEAFGDSVRVIRQSLAKVIPRRPPAFETLAFYRRIAEGETDSLPTEHAKLLEVFKCLSDNTADMICIHDHNGNVLYLNGAVQGATGYTAEDVFQGLTLYDLVVPEYLKTLDVRMESPERAFDFAYRSEIYARDGRRIPMEIRTHAAPSIAGENAVMVTARVLEEESVETAHRSKPLFGYFAELLDNAPFAVLLSNAQGRVLDANQLAARMYGVGRPESLRGRYVLGVSTGEDGERAAPVLAETVEKGEVAQLRPSAEGFTGPTVETSATIVPLRDRKLLVFLIDISDQAMLEQNMVQMEKLCSLGEIVAGVAHDLNNPLTGIVGYADLLLMSSESESVHGRVEHIMHEAERSRVIVQNLLKFARHHGHEKTLQCLNDVIEDTLLLREHQLNVENIQVVRELCPDLPHSRVDFHELQRVFMNLLNNAQHAFRSVDDGRSKKITVRTGVENDVVRVRIEDNGPGIPEESQAKVFDAFYTTKPVGEGTGLGLSVSAEIVHDHGGEISMESEPGKGTAFTVSIPAASSNS